jgi:hypothetical protein
MMKNSKRTLLTHFGIQDTNEYRNQGVNSVHTMITDTEKNVASGLRNLENVYIHLRKIKLFYDLDPDRSIVDLNILPDYEGEWKVKFEIAPKYPREILVFDHDKDIILGKVKANDRIDFDVKILTQDVVLIDDLSDIESIIGVNNANYEKNVIKNSKPSINGIPLSGNTNFIDYGWKVHSDNEMELLRKAYQTI